MQTQSGYVLPLYRFKERDDVSQELHNKLQTAQTDLRSAQTDLRTAQRQVMYTVTTCIQVGTACKYASAATPAVHAVSSFHTRHIGHLSGVVDATYLTSAFDFAGLSLDKFLQCCRWLRGTHALLLWRRSAAIVTLQPPLPNRCTFPLNQSLLPQHHCCKQLQYTHIALQACICITQCRHSLTMPTSQHIKD